MLFYALPYLMQQEPISAAICQESVHHRGSQLQGRCLFSRDKRKSREGAHTSRSSDSLGSQQRKIRGRSVSAYAIVLVDFTDADASGRIVLRKGFGKSGRRLTLVYGHLPGVSIEFPAK